MNSAGASHGMSGEMSPRRKARITGVLYLATIVMGIYAQGFISDRLIVSGDAVATANNIIAHESLFRLGFSIYLIEMMCQIAATMLFYELLKPVNRSIALLAAVFGLIGCTIKTMSRLFYFSPLFILGGGAHYLAVFNSEQLRSLSLLFLNINDQGAAIALVFFGVHALLKGYLILRSIFLPRFVGVFSLLGGVGLLAFIWPPLGYRLFPAIAVVGMLGALVNIGWLITFGVNEERWREQARATAGSI